MKHEAHQLAPATKRMLRLPEVKKAVGLGRSSIYEQISQGQFPSPVRLGPRAVAWVSDEISAWIDARIAARKVAR